MTAKEQILNTVEDMIKQQTEQNLDKAIDYILAQVEKFTPAWGDLALESAKPKLKEAAMKAALGLEDKIDGQVG